jgi:hypothetical protein
VNYIRHLNAFFTQIKKDDRLTAMHVSLYLALFQYWNFNRFQNPFPVYRDNIMALSKIGSKNTYHKCVRALHQTGYIIYHAAPSKYLPVKISIIRFDTKESPHPLKQLDLFSEMPNPELDHPPLEGAARRAGGGHPPLEGVSTAGGRGRSHVPNLSDTSISNETQQVPNLGHPIKQINILKKDVVDTCTGDKMKNSGKNKNTGTMHVSNLRHIPLLDEVEAYFKELYKSPVEAQKFYYYNQSKNWMLTDKIPVYDWKALANKWMLNDKSINGPEVHSNLNKEIQYLYERFLEGEKINKLIAAEYADHLELTLTETLLQQAWQRRINQLSGSNEASEIKLWHAYMQSNPNDQLIITDQPNFLALAKRLAVSKHFQKLKSGSQKNVFTNTTDNKD